MTTLEGNKIIAEFMKAYYPKDDKYPFRKPGSIVKYRDAEYHSSWDWLMPVVEKIESIGFICKIEQDYCLIHGKEEGQLWGAVPFEHRKDFDKKRSVWLSCISFIQWFNTQTPTP